MSDTPKCAQCGAHADGSIYDEREDNYFCDVWCWHDWADDHFIELIMFYATLNIKDGGR